MEHEVEIKGKKYKLKKFSFKDRCTLKSKMLKVIVDNSGKTSQEVDAGEMFFWNLVLSLKSTPEHPEFNNYDVKRKQEIVSDMEEEGELLLQEALQLNKMSVDEDLKKN